MEDKIEKTPTQNNKALLESAAYGVGTWFFIMFTKADPQCALLTMLTVGSANIAVRKITNHQYGLFDGAYEVAKKASDYLKDISNAQPEANPKL